MTEYNIAYTDTRFPHSGEKLYLGFNVTDIRMAFEYLDQFIERYLWSDGTGKPYSNRRGNYTFTDPRIVEII